MSWLSVYLTPGFWAGTALYMLLVLYRIERRNRKRARVKVTE